MISVRELGRVILILDLASFSRSLGTLNNIFGFAETSEKFCSRGEAS